MVLGVCDALGESHWGNRQRESEGIRESRFKELGRLFCAEATGINIRVFTYMSKLYARGGGRPDICDLEEVINRCLAMAAVRVIAYVMLISNPQLEAEYLLSAEPNLVLKYLYELAESFDRKKSYLFRKRWEPAEGLVERLMDRKSKAIDVGLLYSCPEAHHVETILKRYDPSSKGDLSLDVSGVMTAAYGNRNTLSHYGSRECSYWLEKRLPWIASRAEFNDLKVLFSNPDLPTDLLKLIFKREGPFEAMEEKRYLGILLLALNSEAFANCFKDSDHTFDHSGYKCLMTGWGTLLTIERSPMSESALSEFLEKQAKADGVWEGQVVKVPFALPDGIKTKEDFVDRVSKKWRDETQLSESEWKSCGAICEYSGILSKAKAEFLMNHEDVWVRRAYYMSFYAANITGLESAFERDGKWCLSCFVENPSFCEEINRKAGRWLIEKLESITPYTERNDFFEKDMLSTFRETISFYANKASDIYLHHISDLSSDTGRTAIEEMTPHAILRELDILADDAPPTKRQVKQLAYLSHKLDREKNENAKTVSQTLLNCQRSIQAMELKMVLLFWILIGVIGVATTSLVLDLW